MGKGWRLKEEAKEEGEGWRKKRQKGENQEGGLFIEMAKSSSTRVLGGCPSAGIYKPDHGQPKNLGMQSSEPNRMQGRVKLLGARALAQCLSSRRQKAGKRF